MNRLIFVVMLFLLFSCNSEDKSKASGPSIQRLGNEMPQSIELNNMVVFFKEQKVDDIIIKNLNGDSIVYKFDNRNGKLKEKWMYKNFKTIDSAFFFGSTSYNPESPSLGASASILSYVFDAKVRKWYENGQLNYKANYEDCKLHGNLIKYNREGEVLFKGVMKNGNINKCSPCDTVSLESVEQIGDGDVKKPECINNQFSCFITVVDTHIMPAISAVRQ